MPTECSVRGPKSARCTARALTSSYTRPYTPAFRHLPCRKLAHRVLALSGDEVDNTPVYAVAALTLASFGLTFGVAPQFRSYFKEDDDWRDIFQSLMSTGGLESISPEEAQQRVERGDAVLMDVRLARKFEEGGMQYSQNFPLYQPISGWGVAANIRRAGFAFFGIFGTERNPGWLQQVNAVVPRGREVIVACDMGGSLETKPGAETGFQSQSLKAAYYLKQAGYQPVHMKGGVSEYRRSMGGLLDVEDILEAPEKQEEPAQRPSGFFRIPFFK